MIKTQTLFQSDNLLVRYTAHDPVARSRIFISFPALDDNQTLFKEAFGEKWYVKDKLDAVLITCAHNQWFQYPEIVEALQAIRAVTMLYEVSVSYGSSMGGYGAIMTSSFLEPSAVVAVAPQFSVDKAKVSFENRWNKYRNTIPDFTFDDHASQIGKAKLFIMYDPFYERDLKHVQRIREFANFTPMLTAFGGHLCAELTMKAGILRKSIFEVADSLFRPDKYVRSLRTRRPAIARTWSMLAERAARDGKERLAIAAAKRGLEIEPESLSCLRVLASYRQSDPKFRA